MASRKPTRGRGAWGGVCVSVYVCAGCDGRCVCLRGVAWCVRAHRGGDAGFRVGLLPPAWCGLLASSVVGAGLQRPRTWGPLGSRQLQSGYVATLQASTPAGIRACGCPALPAWCSVPCPDSGSTPLRTEQVIESIVSLISFSALRGARVMQMQVTTTATFPIANALLKPRRLCCDRGHDATGQTGKLILERTRGASEPKARHVGSASLDAPAPGRW